MANLTKLPIRGGYVERLGASGRVVFELESGEIATVGCDVVPGPAREDEPKDLEADALLENERAALEKDGGTKQASEDDLARELAAHEEEDRRQAAPLKGKLPVDFPERDALANADPPVTTYTQLRNLIASGTDEKPWYQGVPKIGEAKAGTIEEALGVSGGEGDGEE